MCSGLISVYDYCDCTHLYFIFFCSFTANLPSQISCWARQLVLWLCHTILLLPQYLVNVEHMWNNLALLACCAVNEQPHKFCKYRKTERHWVRSKEQVTAHCRKAPVVLRAMPHFSELGHRVVKMLVLPMHQK